MLQRLMQTRNHKTESERQKKYEIKSFLPDVNCSNRHDIAKKAEGCEDFPMFLAETIRLSL